LLSLPNFGDTDRRLYENCENKANTSAQLAKCLVPFLREIENKRNKMKTESNNNDVRNDENERSLVSHFGSWLIQGLDVFKVSNEEMLDEKKNTRGKKKKYNQMLRALRRRKQLLFNLQSSYNDKHLPAKTRMKR
jgi:hypothetical protein